VYLHLLTGDGKYLDAARRAAAYLTRQAWNAGLGLFPFECQDKGSEQLAYFFDCGIIVRGLLSLWRVTGAGELLDVAAACGRSMAVSFAAGAGEFHPILRLPERLPIPRSDQWSRQSGCYQLKSALAWHDLHKATGEAAYLSWYEDLLAASLANHESFLPGAEGDRIMDRLHAYSYFLEAILPRHDRPEVVAALARGIAKVSLYRRQIGPQFMRSDVCAQLLRVRLLAGVAGAVPVDRQAAESEAGELARFQLDHSDPRIHGGFYFARRGDRLQPHVNPVSTAFGLQALAMWSRYLSGELAFSTDILI
jgi:hypothetical protein